MAYDIPVIILHGWSDTSASFVPLGNFLRANGFNVVDIWLGDYLSMNDEITLFDLGTAFGRALDKNAIPQKRYSFDLIVHSTGGLVAREYLRQVCAGDATKTPVKHLCMLSPANFGSPLAALGKTMLGRLLKGWDWNHFGQTGTQILNALDLAAPYSWELALADLFNPQFKIFTPANALTTVFVGTVAYDNPIRSAVHENGSDGTVRVATANLNAHAFSVDFADPQKPVVRARPKNFDPIAFAVFPRNHTTVHDPAQPDPNGDWTKTLIKALTIEPGDYGNHLADCQRITSSTFQNGLTSDHPEWFNQYEHVVFHVHDQYGSPITDYMVEFYQEEGDPKDKVFNEIHGDILEKVTTNKQDGSFRSFFLNTDRLTAYLATQDGADIQMSFSAANVSERIIYRNPTAGIDVFTTENQALLFPNEPVLIDVTLYRDQTDEVFKLGKLP